MSGLSEELNLGGGKRKPAANADLVAVIRMPGEDHFRVLESAGLEHEGLADQNLLGRGTKHLDRPRQLLLDSSLVRRNRGRHRRRAQQVVPAPVARSALNQGSLLRLPGLL